MTNMSNYFSRLEAYQNLEVAIIRATKINKVLKMIVKLSSIPRDEEFQFRKRAVDMLSQWKNDLELDTTINPEDKEDKDEKDDKDDKAADEKKEAQPQANGSHDENKEDSNEPLDEPMTDADAAPKEGDKGDKGDQGDKEDKAEEKAEEKTEEKASESKAENTEAAA